MVAAMLRPIFWPHQERCAVKTEILGFTTRAWKGGQSTREMEPMTASPPIPAA